MPYQDLREFLQRLREKGELATVSAEVDPKYEIGAISRKAIDKRGPALLFKNVKGCSVPLVTDYLGNRKRFALALETSVEKIQEEWIRRTRQPLDPVIVENGPCKQNILKGAQVDLTQFPIPVWNQLDGGPFITFPHQITRDPISGTRNMAIYRGQLMDQRTIGILAVPSRHLALHRARMQGQPFPVAIALGVDPVVSIAACAPFPFGVDELAMAGALREQPVELVRCESVPLEVPATAEVVLEGWMYPEDSLFEEGPFGEYTGYYGERRPKPVIRIETITHRDNPIFPGCYVGRPPDSSEVVTSIPIEAEIRRMISLPGIKKIYSTKGGSHFNVVISIEKLCEGYGKMVGMAVMGTWASRLLKNLIIVDDDIDPENSDEVEWALATRVQPHRDIEIIRDLPGSSLDPSIPDSEKSSGHARTSKMIIDATRYDSQNYELACSPDPETLKKVEANWSRYGLEF